MTDGIVPISDDERRARIAKAQRLMAEQKIDAIFMEGTASCFYFVNMRWGQSERTFGVVIPAKGEIAYVCPKFEEDRARELIKFGNDVRTWEEDESPYKLIVQIVKDRGVQHRRIGMEERVRFFIADGVRKESAGMEIVDATPVTAGCRIYKSAAEIALMQRAMDVTIEAYKLALATLRDGMPQNELGGQHLERRFARSGFSGSASVQFGKWTALPHGSITPQRLKEGDVVMIDGGTSCEGYQSDITRTTVFGKADAAADRRLESREAGPDGRLRGDEARRAVREWSTPPRARSSSTPASDRPTRRPACPIAPATGSASRATSGRISSRATRRRSRPGMCFSDEPMVAIPGEFGIRLEDCVYFTDAGAKFFTKQSLAIDQPFG